MSIEEKLFTVKTTPDSESHLNPDFAQCPTCESKACVYVCPANVYEWDEEHDTLIMNYENCLECGACRIACEKQCIRWRYPKGTKGVKFKLG